MDTDLGALIKAIGGFWETFWGKVLVILASLWYLVHKHAPELLTFLKERQAAEQKEHEEEARGEFSHIDHLRAQARESREAFTKAVETRIAILEDALVARNAKIEELIEHKIECNESLARLEEKYSSLSARLTGYGRAVDQLRSDAVDKEKTDDSFAGN